ncbi:glutathione S-transferase [Tistlia consotensis]|uniref:Glutathione S-transferase n=1 Tax=Tistlia consotensis USBA 355 TaxID=560819 RepID=A0A1Y6BP99_9PROT|nr:glutathione S-transferase family protein [Tistlia consotensis]SMF13777.1 glutathione S-transferase [Tistlia consotensis USBA 355]SNR50211.1 glutathione S-transferase [Tistlia consotensis]
MKLYYAETLNPRKACAVAKQLQVPLDYVRVDLGKGENRTPAFLALNPNGKVPVLELGDGRTLWESNAIMAHLARQAGSELWPADGERQIEVLRWLAWNDVHFTRHAGTLYFERIIKPMFGIGAENAAATEEATGFLRRFGKVLDDHLRGRHWLLGDAMTIADFAAAIALPYRAARLPLDDFDEIRRWHGQLQELPAWREPFPADRAAA